MLSTIDALSASARRLRLLLAYLLTSLGVILLLVGNILDDELGFPLTMISLCLRLSGTLEMMLRLMGWMNELLERMKNSDPAVCWRAQTMQTWMMTLILVSIIGIVIFALVQEVWLGGWLLRCSV